VAGSSGSRGCIPAFRFERDLVESAAPTLRSALASVIPEDSCSWYAVAYEVVVGSVVPDIVIGVADSIPHWPRRSVSVVEAHVIAQLVQKGAMRVNELVETLYLSDTGAQRAISAITSAGFAGSTDGGYVIPKCYFSNARVIAVEFKLRKWREALAQASAYRDFANESYVVLDSSQVTDEQRVCAAFTGAGVGLIFARGATLDVAVRSHARESVSAGWIQVLQKLYSVADSGVPHPSFKSP
jgi:hypothetical protein